MNQHTGHLIPDSVCGAYLRYDLRILGVQCMSCNIRHGGMGAEYYRVRAEKFGVEWVEGLFKEKDQRKDVKAIDHYRRILPLYQRIEDRIPNVNRKDLYSPCELLEVVFPLVNQAQQ